MLYQSLQQTDDEIFQLIQEEQVRQTEGLELIASENFTSRAVLESLGSCLTNKYSEGLPHHRYYGGNEVIDKIEIIAQQRALSAFGLNNEKWGVNVQGYSGTPANFAVYTALLNPHERFMGLDLPSGGHLSHGYMNEKRKVSATSIFWETFGYKIDSTTGLLNYDKVEEMARAFKPKMIVVGASAYPREWDYSRMRAIADSVGAILMADIAHIAGLVVANEALSPFEYCDIVTTTTHKTLRGPRGAIVYFRIGAKNEEEQYDFESRINFAIFPGLQGGPHNNVVAAIATTLKQASTDEFKAYAKQIKVNASVLAQAMINKGYHIVTNGTDNHLFLWDLKPLQITGSKMEALYEMVNISVNKNTCYGDENAIAPRGLRVGTPAVTSRGLGVDDMNVIAEFFHRGVVIALDIQSKMKGKTAVEFKKLAEDREDIAQLKEDVKNFSVQFPLPGYN